MKRTIRTAPSILVGAAILLAGCGPKVLVPPRVDLSVYGNVGMIEISSNARGNLQQYATQEFLETVQSSQPGVRILELGTKEKVLRAIERDELDFEAFREIGDKYDVDAVLTGNLDVANVKPKLHISPSLGSIGVEAEVEALLTAKLFETGRGATLWSNSAHGKGSVANVTITSGGPAFFNATEPEEAYGKLVNGLLRVVTKDLQPTYKRK